MNILVLGAGLMQKPAILSAKEAGFTVHVIDADSKAVAIPYADTFRQIDLKDKEGILNYAKELKNSEGGLSAVFTAGTDFSASVSYVCEALGLPAHSYEAAINASVKTTIICRSSIACLCPGRPGRPETLRAAISFSSLRTTIPISSLRAAGEAINTK